MIFVDETGCPVALHDLIVKQVFSSAEARGGSIKILNVWEARGGSIKV